MLNLFNPRTMSFTQLIVTGIIITFGFFFLLVGIDVALAYQGITTNVPFTELADQLWDNDTQALFAAIISFHFGGRAFGK